MPTGNDLGQKTLTEGVPRHRVAVRCEAQLIRRRGGRVVGKSRLHVVEHHRALGQPERGAGTALADRIDDVGRSDVDRLADAGAVETQAGHEFVQPADAREQPFQGVTLHLPCGIVDDLPVQSRETSPRPCA